MQAVLVLIILLPTPDGSTHAENMTSKTFTFDLNTSLLLHHANKSCPSDNFGNAGLDYSRYFFNKLYSPRFIVNGITTHSMENEVGLMVNYTFLTAISVKI